MALTPDYVDQVMAELRNALSHERALGVARQQLVDMLAEAPPVPPPLVLPSEVRVNATVENVDGQTCRIVVSPTAVGEDRFKVDVIGDNQSAVETTEGSPAVFTVPRTIGDRSFSVEATAVNLAGVLAAVQAVIVPGSTGPGPVYSDLRAAVSLAARQVMEWRHVYHPGAAKLTSALTAAGSTWPYAATFQDGILDGVDGGQILFANMIRLFRVKAVNYGRRVPAAGYSDGYMDNHGLYGRCVEGDEIQLAAVPFADGPYSIHQRAATLSANGGKMHWNTTNLADDSPLPATFASGGALSELTRWADGRKPQGAVRVGSLDNKGLRHGPLILEGLGELAELQIHDTYAEEATVRGVVYRTSFTGTRVRRTRYRNPRNVPTPGLVLL